MDGGQIDVIGGPCFCTAAWLNLLSFFLYVRESGFGRYPKANRCGEYPSTTTFVLRSGTKGKPVVTDVGAERNVRPCASCTRVEMRRSTPRSGLGLPTSTSTQRSDSGPRSE